MADAAPTPGPLSDRLEHLIDGIAGEQLRVGTLVAQVGSDGLLLLAMLLATVFLVPVSIPGLSTAFGAVILLIGLARLRARPLWLPARLQARTLPADAVRSALRTGLRWVRRLEGVSRPGRMTALATGRAADVINHLAFVFATVLLMAPFGFIPFSNTLPALALLLYALGLLQRDGLAIALGHAATLATLGYFGLLIAGGGYAALGLWQRLAGAG